MANHFQEYMSFNEKNWTIETEIKKRVNKEALYNWAISKTDTRLPKYEKPQKLKLTAGVFNMCRQLLP